MTGQELFQALSYVDERYIAEAQTRSLGIHIPWTKIISVAACLCILITGVLALDQIGLFPKAPEAAAPEAAPEATPEAAPPMPEEMITESDGEPATIPGELHHVAYAQLRILEVLEDGGFTVFVTRVPEEPGPVEAGVEMTLVIDPEMIPMADRTELEYSGDITEDMLVEIHNGAYDAGINTLYAEGVIMAAIE